MVDRVQVERQSPTRDESAVRERLEAEGSRLTGLIVGLKHEGLDRESGANSIGEIAPSSHREADVGSETLQRELDLSLLKEFRNELSEVELALARLAEGSYGACAGCYDRIDPDRLEAVPAAWYCKACQDRYEFDGALVAGPVSARVGVSSMRPSSYPTAEDALAPATSEAEEASLDELRDEESVDENGAAPTAGEEVPRSRQSDEFLCSTCFQLKRRTQLIDPVRSRCVDCANNGADR